MLLVSVHDSSIDPYFPYALVERERDTRFVGLF